MQTRPIKFRAWDKENREMVEVLECNFKELMVCLPGFESGKKFSGWHSLDNIELMQYTGLKDKNGQEIYEGDVIKGNLIKYSPLPIMGEVVWDNELSGFASKNNAGNTLLFEIDQIRIIGDKFQNPELLNHGPEGLKGG